MTGLIGVVSYERLILPFFCDEDFESVTFLNSLQGWRTLLLIEKVSVKTNFHFKTQP